MTLTNSVTQSTGATGTRTWVQESPLGPLTITVGAAGLRSLRYGSTPETKAASEPEPTVADALDAYFAGDLGAPSALRVDLTGLTTFTRAVLSTLAAVPPSELVGYGQLAAMAGYPGRARAVGRAMASNPVPIVIPCHRVVAGDGSLGGYSGGTEVKRWLLAHEGHDVGSPDRDRAQAPTGSSSTPSLRR